MCPPPTRPHRLRLILKDRHGGQHPLEAELEVEPVLAGSRVACATVASMPAGLRRDLGTIESYATLLGILIGAGIFKVTGEAWSLTGPSVILGYLVLAPVILATSVAYSVFLSTPLGKVPGGEYAHISRTFGGYGLAFVGAWLKIISYIGALAYLASAFADYLLQLVPVTTPRVVSTVLLLFFYIVHVAGVRWFGWL